MRSIFNSAMLSATVAIALLINLIAPPQLSASSARMELRTANMDLKSESQVRSEAARYESAIRAIGDIASMRLENPDEMKKALAILDREGPNLKFQRSKLIVLGLGDSTFAASVKKAAPDKAAAETLIKEVNADPQAVLKLNGAQPLVTKLGQSTEADAATLRRVSER